MNTHKDPVMILSGLCQLAGGFHSARRTDKRSTKRETASSGFTMVDLLVVMAILVVWLAVLIPVGAQTKERPRRISCLNNVKQWTTAVLIYADDHENILPRARPGGGANAYWVDQKKFRDLFNTNYGISRAEFYCPANPSWNRNDCWNWAGANQDTVMGYHYFGGEPSFTNNSALVRLVPYGRLGLALKTTDQPYFTVLFADLVRKLNGTWGRPGDSMLDHGANHHDNVQPIGANEGFLDGHAEWVKAEAPWIRFPKLTLGTTQVFMQGGPENP